jgi:hypothetical protein
MSQAARECLYCRETDASSLPVWHYPGLRDSTHIQCETCGMEFSIAQAERAARVTSIIRAVLSSEPAPTDIQNLANDWAAATQPIGDEYCWIHEGAGNGGWCCRACRAAQQAGQ